MKITSANTIRQILRLRPLSVELFEKEAGGECWYRLDETLSEFCESRNCDPEGLAGRISNLDPVSSDTDWMAKPIYYLVDHLTRNHADFREVEMTGIADLLSDGAMPIYPDKYVIKLLSQEFAYFRQEFLKHMMEEETFLYPKILRNEACFRFKELEPEAYKGSINLYLKLETHKPEIEFDRMLTSIREKLRFQRLRQPAAGIAERVQAALESFAVRLNAHARLETEILFPRAGRLEQELYESAAPGLSRFPGDQ